MRFVRTDAGRHRGASRRHAPQDKRDQGAFRMGSSYRPTIGKPVVIWLGLPLIKGENLLCDTSWEVNTGADLADFQG